MTGALALDWAIMAVSLFNTILLLWLGLTVLLNAERKSWGVRLTGGGLLTGGVFFISHSAILGRGLHTASRGSDFWWHVGWLPVILSPVAWYVVMLWYAGFWGNVRGMVRRRHRTWLVGVVAISACAGTYLGTRMAKTVGFGRLRVIAAAILALTALGIGSGVL